MSFQAIETTSSRPYLSTFDLMWNDQNGLCCYCEQPMIHKEDVPKKQRSFFLANPTMATVEHLHRTADGGSNAPGNLRLACSDCNQGRGTVDWATYKSYKLGELTV